MQSAVGINNTMSERMRLWKLILMLAACVSQQHKACYTQIATFTIAEQCFQVLTGSMGESELKTGVVARCSQMHYLDCGEFD